MPELPEVETIRRDLAHNIVGKKIVGVEVRDKKNISVSVILTRQSAGKDLSFAGVLKNKKITAVERRGKLLAFKLSSGQYLLTHLKMTGQLIYLVKSSQRGGSAKGGAFNGVNIVAGGHELTAADLAVPNKFTRVIISLVGGAKLYFNDMRRFGYMKVVPAEEKERIWKNDFGIEPLTPDFKFNNFKKLLAGRKTNIKALLMNQKLIAGLGNIYADEACFCARILPWRRVGSLKPAEIKKLYRCIPQVLKTAIKNRGTTFSHFRDSAGQAGGHLRFLNVYERAGEKCRRCGGIIKKTRHAGRGTHYCPRCQK